MWLLAAALTVGAVYAACLAFVRALRQRPLALAAATAVGVTVCAEACIVHALSVFHAVGRPGLLIGNGVVALAVGGWAWRRGHQPGRRWVPRLGSSAAGFALLAVSPLILFSALAYPPNNWDSMTYHLARVGYWLQAGSVAGYPTAIQRQLVLPPGAEYLLLALQGIARSDRLDALVQFGSWVAIAAAAPPLARTFGVPRRFAPWAALVAAGGAMAVLQASSTQNDLVAAVIAVGVVASCVPFLHGTPRAWRAADLVLIALGVAAGLVVKPSGLVAAGPFLAYAAWRAFHGLGRPDARAALIRAAPVLAVVAAVVLPPAVAARQALRPDGLLGPFLYRGSADLLDRPVNAVRGLVRNVPVPLAAIDRLLAPQHTPGCAQENGLCLVLNTAPIEDLAASPGPMLLVVLGLALAVAGWGKLPARARLGAIAWCAAWFVFHGTFRDNAWITRLQLPLLALAPAALGGLARPGPRLLRGLATLLLAAAATHAAVAATLNFKRPFSGASELLPGARPAGVLAEVRGALSDQGYYRYGPPGLGAVHAAVLDELRRSGCRHLALFLGEDSWDYPLSWRAMRAGVEVRHLVGGEEAWACAVFSDHGEPAALTASPGRWTAVAGVPWLFLAAEGSAPVPAAGR